MTTSARLLTILSLRAVLALPLAACAAQLAPAVPAAKPAMGQDVQAGSTAGPASAAPATAPAAQPSPAQSSSADQAPAQSAATPAQPRHGAAPAARNSAPASAADVPAPAITAPATTPSTLPAPASNAPAVDPASPSLPETTVGGGAANRPAPVQYNDRPRAGMPAPMPTGSATGSLLQTLFALIAVLAVLGALAWFLKRYGPKAMGGSAHLRIVGSLNLGGRERLLVVEVGNQWIVVGASPGRVNALATMPKQDGMDGGAGADGVHATLSPHVQPAHSFADWLKQTLDKRK
jgi:flagellar protein FliO/FliZ